MSEELLYQGKWISMYSKTVTSRSGKQSKWEYIRRIRENPEGDGIDVIAKYKGCLILVAVYRYPVSRMVLEFPSGLVEDLNVVQAALKELKEETGYLARESDIQEISPVIYSDPWKSTESIRYAIVEVPDIEENQHPVQELEDEEIIHVELVSFDRLLDNILSLIAEKGYALDSRLYLFAKGIDDQLSN